MATDPLWGKTGEIIIMYAFGSTGGFFHTEIWPPFKAVGSGPVNGLDLGNL